MSSHADLMRKAVLGLLSSEERILGGGGLEMKKIIDYAAARFHGPGDGCSWHDAEACAEYVFGSLSYDWFIYVTGDGRVYLTPDRIPGRHKLRNAQPELPPLPATASPIEILFWDAHRKLRLPELSGLVPQYPVNRYRLDFALPDLKTGIELDGFASHSSTTDIANDRKRQRALETRGYRIVRFGGQEVHQDAEACVRQTAELVRKWNGDGL